MRQTALSTIDAEPQDVLSEALARIDEFLAESMRVQATPGLALAITDRRALLAVRRLGFADLEAKLPVDEDTRFEFGSIGKSFTAICLLQLAEAGIVDLHAPVATYLPWFSVRSQYEPITLHHLLSHSSGLIGGSDFSPDQRFEVWALRDTEAAQPGIKARYSNVGYKVLGLVLEALTGLRYRQLVEDRILTPLEMNHSVGAITNSERRRLAVGYTDYYSDRPWRPSHGFAPAAWLETNTGDGCLAATATDLAIYLRMLLNSGTGRQGRVFAESSFALLTTAHATFTNGAAYGYGLAVEESNGRRRIRHGGGMIGFSASMLGDLDAGMGIVVFKNAIQATDDIADFALETVISAVTGAPFPAHPPSPAIDLTDYVGEYRDTDGMLAIASDAGHLVLSRQADHIVLEPLGIPPEPDHFLAQRADLALVPFHFQRDDSGRIEALIHGEHWYPASWSQGPTEFATPAEWNAYPGHYRSYNPWNPEFRVVLRLGALWLIYPWGQETLLRPDGDGFRIDNEPEGPESFVFDTIVDGVTLRVTSPGGETYYRFFTP